MLSDFERVLARQRQLEMARRAGDWQAVNLLSDSVDDLRERLAKMDDIRAELDMMANDKRQAGLIWAEVANNYSDVTQRVGRYASGLYSGGLISPDQFKEIQEKLTTLTDSEQRNQDAIVAENKQLDSVIEHILDEVGSNNKQDALGFYNKIGGLKSRDKIRSWIKVLIDEKMLNPAYSLSVKAGDFMTKMMAPFSENK